MKKIILVFLLLCSLVPSARAFNFDLAGKTYSFSTVSGFTPNQTLLSSQVWWNNPTLLSTFVSAVNYQAPNNTGFAFNYTVDGSWVGGAYVDYQSNSYCCGPQGSGAININSANLSTWAVATLLTSTADTQQSLKVAAQKLGAVFNGVAIGSNFANMNTYDCDLFDASGLCVSAGGRYTSTAGPGAENTSAVVVVGFKATPTLRIGGFLDKSINNNAPTGIHLSDKTPLMGMFVVWNQQADTLGYQVKFANAYQAKGVTTERAVVGVSQAGKGITNISMQSYVSEFSYAFNYSTTTLLRPYAAVRYTAIEQDAYTETGVSLPLSYGAIRDRSTTALLGLKLQEHLTPQATLTASLGMEHDLVHKVDRLTATGVSGLTSENLNDKIKNTRPVASLGMMYALSKTQRLSADVFYQELPFQSTGSTTVYLNYMMGL